MTSITTMRYFRNISRYRTTLGSIVYDFADLKTLLAKATPLRSGDQLAGIAAGTAEERVAAQMVLANVALKDFLAEPLIPYEADEVTRLIFDTARRRSLRRSISSNSRSISRLAT